MELAVVYTSASPELGKKLSSVLGAPAIKPIRKEFPDGELYVRIPKKPKKAVVVGSTHQPDRNWVELLLTVDALERMGSEVYVVIPYYGYGRQDKVFLEGEPVSAEVFARALKGLTDGPIITVNPHFFREEGRVQMGGTEIYSISAHREIARWLEDVDVEAVVSPDEGAAWFAKGVADILGLPLVVFRKERDRHTGKIKMKGEKIRGKVVIVDDIIGSGTTMLMASRFIEGEVIFAAVHGVFSRGWERLKERGKVVVTDTIERKESVISVAGGVAEWLKSML